MGLSGQPGRSFDCFFFFGLRDGLADNERFDGFVKLVELRRSAETEMPGSETVTTTETVYAA
jgi:hypothetical protein